MSIQIHTETGALKNTFDGHFYNEHVLEYERVVSVNEESDMVEMEVSCRCCGEHYSARVHTDSEPRIWTIHAWLVGAFDEPCDLPQRKLRRTAKEVVKKYHGKPATADTLRDMKQDVRDGIDNPDAKITFI